MHYKKKLERHLQRAQKMETIGTLAGGVAHDLNNVLTGIVSYPDILLINVPEDSPPDVKIDVNLEKDLLNISGSPIHLSKAVMNLISKQVKLTVIETVMDLFTMSIEGILSQLSCCVEIAGESNLHRGL